MEDYMKRNDKQNLELLIETTIAIKAQTKIQKQVIQELADNGLLVQTFKNGLPSWSVRDDIKITAEDVELVYKKVLDVNLKVENIQI